MEYPIPSDKTYGSNIDTIANTQIKENTTGSGILMGSEILGDYICLSSGINKKIRPTWKEADEF